jgi:integrase
MTTAKPTRRRFSDSSLAGLKVPPGRRELIVFEPSGSGLGARVSRSGRISFIVQLPLKDGTHWRETLGAYGKLTVDAARDAVQAIAGKIALGIDPRRERADEKAAAKAKAAKSEAEKFTVGRLVEQWHTDWLSTKRRGYATRTYRNVRQTFGALLDVPAVALTRADVKKTLAKQRSSETRPAAAHNAAAALCTAYRWATEEELIDPNPLAGLKPQRYTSEPDRVLTTDEARRIYAAACTLPYPAGQFIRLLMLTGCRRAEIAGLRRDEIVTGEDGAKAIELPPARTKSNSGHHVPLSSVAVDVLAGCARHRVVGSPYVLTSDGRRAFADFDRTKSRIDQVLSDSGREIAAWRLHDLRRTIVSTLAAKPFRFNPVMLDLLLGHQPSQLTPIARVYAREKHLDDRAQALEAWAKHLTQPPATVSDLQQERDRGTLR